MNAPAPRIPPDGRLAELVRLQPSGWYRDHAGSSAACDCHLMAPDEDCDVGQALFRLGAKEIVRRA